MADDNVLVPRPRKLRRLEGAYAPAPGRFVWLAGRVTSELLRIGWAVKAALAEVGPTGQAQPPPMGALRGK